MKKISFLFLVLVTSFAFSQKNQFDAQNKRHGLWSKNYLHTDQIRYQGEFNHGKEIGTFKFYKLKGGKSVLSATKEFSLDSDIINVTFFTSSGKIISKGKMKAKAFIGKWVYYHNKSETIMTLENYNDKGELHGEKITYYKNAQIAEKKNYVNGKKEGLSLWYSQEGVVLKELNYKNDMFNGLSKYYDANGKLIAEGYYRNDKKHGIWMYTENGKTKKKDHTVKSKNPKRQ